MSQLQLPSARSLLSKCRSFRPLGLRPSLSTFTDPDDGKLRRAVSCLQVLDLQVLPYDKDEAVLALSSHSAVASCRDATRKLRYRRTCQHS